MLKNAYILKIKKM